MKINKIVCDYSITLIWYSDCFDINIFSFIFQQTFSRQPFHFPTISSDLKMSWEIISLDFPYLVGNDLKVSWKIIFLDFLCLASHEI